MQWDDFVISPATSLYPPTRNLHLAFVAESRHHIEEFWNAGIKAGFADDGAPGERLQYKSDYFGAFLLDPDGNSVEAVHHGDTRSGGHLDHLWIRVHDLTAAEKFYGTIARYTGLRPGGRWDEGVSVRGAWALLALIADGKPQTEHLNVAFPAPDRATVDRFHRAAIEAGYRSNGEPAERLSHHESCFSASALDDDGTTVESVYRLNPVGTSL